MSACPSEQIILDFLDGRLDAQRGAAVHEHVDGCASCRALLASLAPSINRSTIDPDQPKTHDTRNDTPGPEPQHRTASLQPGSDPTVAGGLAGAASVLPLVAHDRYDVRDEFARGGLGRIFRAHDRRLARPVAVKQLIAGGAEAARRFIREALITARLQHPAIVPIYEAGRWPSGEPFYAMKLVSGRSLDQVIRAKKTLSERLTLLPNLIAVAEAMAYAHSQRIIHRDLKPANVLVGSFGETVLIDWGLAKDLNTGSEVAMDAMMAPYSDDSTEVGTVLGTPTYMPPEQAEGKAVDERADVYALGAVLYHVLAGGPPYAGSSSAETLARVLSEAPVSLTLREPGVPRDLVTVVEKAMARDAALRYPTAKELADDLVRFQAGQLVSAHRYSAMEMSRRWVAKHRAPVSVAVALLTALAMTGALAVSRIAHERDRARRERAEARAAQAQAEKRSSELVLAQAQSSLDDDPTAAVAWLKQYPDTGDWRAAQSIFADALSRGVAERVWSGVSRARFSADGRLALWGADGAVRLWSQSGKLETLGGSGARVREIAFSPSGAQLLIQRVDDAIELWDVKAGTGKPLHRRAASYEMVRFAPDGKWLAGVADDGSIDLWSLPHGTLKPLVDTHARATALWFVGADKLAVGGQDRQVRLYDLETGESRVIGAHQAQVNRVRASVDGRFVVSSDPLNLTNVWDLKSGRSRKFFGRAEQGLMVSEFAADDTLALALGGGALVLIDPQSGATRTLRGHAAQVTHAEFAPDGKHLVSGAEDGVVRVWDIATGEATTLHGHSAEISSVSISPDGTHVATGSADKSVRLWSLGGDRHVVRHPDNELYAVSFSPDGSRVAVGGAGGLVELCDAATLGCRALAGPRGEVEAVAFLRDGRLVSGSFDATVHLWDATGKHLNAFAGEEPIWSLAPSPDGTHVAFSAAERTLATVDLATGAKKELRSDGALSTWDVAYSPDGTLIAVGEGPDVRVWDWANDTSRPLRGHAALVQHVAFSPSGDMLASASGDTTVALWTLADGKPRFLRGHTNTVKWVTFSPDGAMLASSGLDGNVRLWRVSDGSGRTLVGHHGAVPCVAFSPDGRLLASGGDDRTVRLWDTSSGESRVVRGHERPVRSIVFSPDGKMLASVGRDGALLLVRIEELPQPLFGGHDARTLRPLVDRATTAQIGPDDRPVSPY
ncbi:MAG: High-affnity carbon uptake protein Hat/HatR [Myxococcales bacterium]|nr:High-affnity carbon uptake protein Hat/HatR [Myxococcales bacterium]